MSTSAICSISKINPWSPLMWTRVPQSLKSTLIDSWARLMQPVSERLTCLQPKKDHSVPIATHLWATTGSSRRNWKKKRAKKILSSYKMSRMIKISFKLLANQKKRKPTGMMRKTKLSFCARHVMRRSSIHRKRTRRL